MKIFEDVRKRKRIRRNSTRTKTREWVLAKKGTISITKRITALYIYKENWIIATCNMEKSKSKLWHGHISNKLIWSPLQTLYDANIKCDYSLERHLTLTDVCMGLSTHCIIVHAPHTIDNDIEHLLQVQVPIENANGWVMIAVPTLVMPLDIYRSLQLHGYSGVHLVPSLKTLNISCSCEVFDYELRTNCICLFH